MDRNRLPVRVYNWEKSLNHKGWVKDVQFILQYCNIDCDSDLSSMCDLDMASARRHKLNQDKWWLDAETKTKNLHKNT